MAVSSKPLFKPGIGVAIAIAGFLLLSSAGKYLAFHVNRGDWSFPIFDDSWDYQYTYIPCFYLAFFGSQLPAVAFLAMTIRVSQFARAQWTVFWILLVLALLSLSLSAIVGLPFSLVPHVNQGFAFLCQVASVLLLPPAGVFCVWLADRLFHSHVRSDSTDA